MGSRFEKKAPDPVPAGLRFAGALVALCAATQSPSPLGAQEPSPLATAAAMERLVTAAIERAERSVVAIARVRREASQPPRPQEPPLPIIPGVGEADPTDPAFVPHEFGSGVVIDAKGLIVTNFHVVGDHRFSDYYVWISRKPYAARLKAADPWLDLAVLQVAAEELRPIPMGDARSLKKGQFVIALGNPYAIARDGQPSAALGIVSNLQRQAPPIRTATRGSDGRETLHHWGTLIQTDARLELGTSGGALVNLRGEMVGLTTSLAALAGYERPGGFAVPVDDDFRRVLETLKAGRLPDYGFLGIAPEHLTAAERQRGLFGARVADVVPATPAAAAGLRSGDIITQVDGEPVADDMELVRRVSARLADTTVALHVLRGGSAARPGRPLKVEVKLAKKLIESGRHAFAEMPEPDWRGMRVEYATASPLFRERCRQLAAAGCVGVLDVARDSPAWKAGLRPGDFVTHVNEAKVTTPREFLDAVADLEGDIVLRLAAVPPDQATRTVAAR